MYCPRESDRHKSRPSFIQLLCMTKQGRWYRPLAIIASRCSISFVFVWEVTFKWRKILATGPLYQVSQSLSRFILFFSLSCVCHSTPLCARMWSREPPLGVERCAAPRWFMVKLSMVKAEIKVQPWDMYLHQNGAQSCTRSYQACPWCCLFRRRGNKSKSQVNWRLICWCLLDICSNLPFH